MDVMSFVPPFAWNSTTADDLNSFSKRAQRVCRENERNNLLAITQLVLNSVLDDAIRSNRTVLLDGVETREINDFFVMLEKILWHGFKAPTSLLSRRKPEAELWNLIGLVGRKSAEMGDLYKSTDQMAELSSPISKIRSFWRLAMMQKRLPDYFQALFDFDSKHEYYEHWACLRSDRSAFLCGAFLALNVFDCNLPTDDAQLQEQINSFELSPYLRLPTLPGHMPHLAEEFSSNGIDGKGALISEEELSLIMSQKQYLEERNRQLCGNIEQMKTKLEQMAENGNTNGDGSLDDHRSLIFTDRLRDLERERDILRARLTEKEDAVRISQEQFNDTKRFTEDLYEKLKAAEARVKRLQKDIGQLREEVEELNNSLIALQTSTDIAKASCENDENGQKEEAPILNRLRQEVTNKTKQYMEMMSTLKAKQQELSGEREQNASLRRRIAELEGRLESLSRTEKELFNLREEHRKTKQQLVESQLALEEFSEALSESKLRMVELKEEIMPLSEAEWVKDSQAVQCRLCDAHFGVVQRRHHCRNCGQIFCNACSSGRAKLPSSSTPMRVCLNCYHLLHNRQLSISSIVDPDRRGGASSSTASLVSSDNK